MKKIMEKSICPKCKHVYINEEIMSSYGDMAVGMKKNRITHCAKCNKKLVNEKLLDNFGDNGLDNQLFDKLFNIQVDKTDSVKLRKEVTTLAKFAVRQSMGGKKIGEKFLILDPACGSRNISRRVF